MVRRHLVGADELGNDFVAGVYPMLLDETCFFLAIDLDKANWQEDAIAVLETCRRLDVPASLERSRSGNGGHIWVFFEAAIPAAIARRLGSHVLTETMEQRPDLGLESYDRLFPNQDTLPREGFGNLIALPLQKRPRSCGNSVFIDDQFRPYDDQWALLSSLGRMSLAAVEELVNRASRNGRVIGVQAPANDDENRPWSMTPSRRSVQPIPAAGLPTSLELTLSDQVYIPKADLPPALRNRLTRLAAFQNPEFYKAQSMRLPTWGKPRVISCAENYENYLALPRGCLEGIQNVLEDLKVKTVVIDQRVAGSTIDVAFHGQLRPAQEVATQKLLCHDTGVLAATTAFGKTVAAISMIAERGVNTLVLVHRRQLLDQWVDRLSEFLQISPKSIGRSGGGRKRLSGRIDVATIQSLVRKGVVKPIFDSWNSELLLDE